MVSCVGVIVFCLCFTCMILKSGVLAEPLQQLRLHGLNRVYNGHLMAFNGRLWSIAGGGVRELPNPFAGSRVFGDVDALLVHADLDYGVQRMYPLGGRVVGEKFENDDIVYRRELQRMLQGCRGAMRARREFLAWAGQGGGDDDHGGGGGGGFGGLFYRRASCAMVSGSVI